MNENSTSDLVQVLFQRSIFPSSTEYLSLVKLEHWLADVALHSSTQDTFGQGFFPDPSLPSQKGRGYSQTRHCPASITVSQGSYIAITQIQVAVFIETLFEVWKGTISVRHLVLVTSV